MQDIRKLLFIIISSVIGIAIFGNSNANATHKNYLAFGIGQTVKTKAKISVVFPWALSLNGYDSYLKNNQSFLTEFGWVFNNNVSLSIEYNLIPHFKYNKFQLTPVNKLNVNKRWRHFDLNHQMYGLKINYLIHLCNNINTKFFMGLGYAINTVTNIYTLDPTATHELPNQEKISHHGLADTKTSPNVYIGTNFSKIIDVYNELFIAIRFDYSQFKVQEIIDYSSDSLSTSKLTPWKGKLKMFQAIIGTSVLFN